MATQVPTTIVNAGLSLPDDKKKELFCRAFTQAIKTYCQKPRLKPRGKFNNYFFDALKNLPPPNTAAGQALASSVIREAPIIVGAVTGTAASLAGTPGAVGGVATALANGYARAAANIVGAGATQVTGGLVGLIPVPGGFTGVVGNCLGIGAMFAAGAGGLRNWAVLRLAGCRLRFPDGLVGNQTLEIKGPHDSYRPGQEKDYKTFNKPGKGFEASGDKCGKRGSFKTCPR